MKEVTLSNIIGETGLFIDGDWVESKDQDANGHVRLIQLADIGDGVFINKSNKFLTSEKAKQLKCTFLKKGDLLIARMPYPLGRACIFPGLNMPCVTVVDICIVRPDENIAYSIWLKFLINSYDFRNKINKYITGTTRQRISRGNLEKLSFRLLPISDQLHIANILTKAENLIAWRKESIGLLDEFLKSTFLEMFGDPENNPKKLQFTELEKLCSVIVDCPHSTPVKSNEQTHFPCIRTSELSNGYITWDSMQYLEETEYIKRTQRLIPVEGDIVYGREGTYGEAIRIPATKKFSLGQRTMLFRPDYKKTNSIFLWAMVRSEYVYRQAKKKNSGSTVGHVNVKDIKQFRVYYPPIELQNQFAAIVLKIEALKTLYQQSLLELENFYGSLSQMAFKGDLSHNFR
jgi:type I restriction enzyme S subunit